MTMRFPTTSHKGISGNCWSMEPKLVAVVIAPLLMVVLTVESVAAHPGLFVFVIGMSVIAILASGKLRTMNKA